MGGFRLVLEKLAIEVNIVVAFQVTGQRRGLCLRSLKVPILVESMGFIDFRMG